jgi:cell division protein FtsL
MVKLLICLFSGVALALFMLNLRHQQLELRHQNTELHDKFKAQQAKLWNQQQQIAVFTAPNAINETVKGQQIDMVPEFSPQRANWIVPAVEHDKSHHGH